VKWWCCPGTTRFIIFFCTNILHDLIWLSQVEVNCDQFSGQKLLSCQGAECLIYYLYSSDGIEKHFKSKEREGSKPESGGWARRPRFTPRGLMASNSFILSCFSHVFYAEFLVNFFSFPLGISNVLLDSFRGLRFMTYHLGYAHVIGWRNESVWR
jgi:hypothetical protein